MLKAKVLSNPLYLKSEFELQDDSGLKFHCTPNYIKNVMKDFLEACKTFLESGTASVELKCDNSSYLFVLSNSACYLIDNTANVKPSMLTFNITGMEICRNVFEEYRENKDKWVKLALWAYTEKMYKEEETALDLLSYEVAKNLKEKS